MSKDYLTHWVLGIICTGIWFFGEKAGIPAAAVQLSASIVPGLLAHALNYVPPSVAPNVAPTEAPNVAPTK